MFYWVTVSGMVHIYHISEVQGWYTCYLCMHAIDAVLVCKGYNCNFTNIMDRMSMKTCKRVVSAWHQVKGYQGTIRRRYKGSQYMCINMQYSYAVYPTLM